MVHSFDTKYQGLRVNSAPYTFNYTCGSGATLLVLSIVTGGVNARAGGSPTYNGVAMTQADYTTQSIETFAELWYMVNPPTGVIYQVSIPNTGTAKYLSPVASSYKVQASYTSELRTTSSDSNPSSTNPIGSALTGLGVGDVVVAVIGTGAGIWNPTGRTGTQLYDRDDGTYGNGAQYLVTTDSSDVAMGWTFGTADDWAIVEAAFREVLLVSTSTTTTTTTSTSTSTTTTTTTLTTTTITTPPPIGKPPRKWEWDYWFRVKMFEKVRCDLLYLFTFKNLVLSPLIRDFHTTTESISDIIRKFNETLPVEWSLVREMDYTYAVANDVIYGFEEITRVAKCRPFLDYLVGVYCECDAPFYESLTIKSLTSNNFSEKNRIIGETTHSLILERLREMREKEK